MNTQKQKQLLDSVLGKSDNITSLKTYDKASCGVCHQYIFGQLNKLVRCTVKLVQEVIVAFIISASLSEEDI